MHDLFQLLRFRSLYSLAVCCGSIAGFSIADLLTAAQLARRRLASLGDLLIWL